MFGFITVLYTLKSELKCQYPHCQIKFSLHKCCQTHKKHMWTIVKSKIYYSEIGISLSGEGHVRVAKIICQRLHSICCEIVLIPKYMVMSRPTCSLQKNQFIKSYQWQIFTAILMEDCSLLVLNICLPEYQHDCRGKNQIQLDGIFWNPPQCLAA